MHCKRFDLALYTGFQRAPPIFSPARYGSFKGIIFPHRERKMDML
jgi:hypothetical protein